MLPFALLVLTARAAEVCAIADLPPGPAPLAACVSGLLEQGYGRAPDAELLSLDPSPFTKEELRFSRSTLQAALPLLRASCPAEDPPGRCARAQEVLQAWIDRRMGTFEACCALEDARPLLDKVLRGEALPADALQLAGGARRWSPLTLWKLRNAVFARHGRTFQNEDLQAFFYGPASLWPELKVKANFSDNDLTVTDRANLALVQAAEARLPETSE
jgi:hypothetical protein